ncbi:MAG: HdeD family acid-resistance protein [Xanthobacteraceae bacterium]
MTTFAAASGKATSRRSAKGGDSAMTEIQALDIRIPAEIIHNWGWFLAFGLGLVLLGILAIVRSVAATVVSRLFFGWLLLIAAGIEIAQAVMVGKWAGLFQHWLSAALFGVLGALIIWRPIVTAEILTLLMGAFFLVAGLFQLVTPFVVSLPEWGWHALNGLITLVLGILILAQWPISGLWVIGLFLGIELIFYGGAWVAVALKLRSAS